MKITIETIQHSDQRYDTVGDWEFNHCGDLFVRVSNMADWRHEVLAGLHEMIEALLCQERNISQREVDRFDMESTSDEPGAEPGCPYRAEHFFAECVERLVAQQLGVDWQDYERAIDGL